MFRATGISKVRKPLERRNLPFSQIRLVPKGKTFRPIMNLRRRVTTMHNGKKQFGQGINHQLRPVYSVLNYEKFKSPDYFGSSMFSIGDLYPKVKAFQASLSSSAERPLPLYFAKVDVKACFDSIPQGELLNLVQSFCSEQAYFVGSHSEIRAWDAHGYSQAESSTRKASQKSMLNAKGISQRGHFHHKLNATLSNGKHNTIFVDAGVQWIESRERLLELLREHIQYNRVKIGKKFFHQKQGIPQGSALSSMLCNLFYGQFEKEYLGFLKGHESLLLRLIDDFLLITTDHRAAVEFLRIMHRGSQTYGIAVRPEKSLANFPCSINGFAIASPTDRTEFPYCGTMINTRTLEVAKERRLKEAGMVQLAASELEKLICLVISDSLTVGNANFKGETFYRKTMRYGRPL